MEFKLIVVMVYPADKVWRHSYLRRSPVCDLLCADWREPSRGTAPHQNQTDPGLVQGGL